MRLRLIFGFFKFRNFLNLCLIIAALFKDNKYKDFAGCIIQLFVFGDKNAGRGVRIAEAWRQSVRHGDDFDCLGGNLANLEAPSHRFSLLINSLINF